MPPLPQQSRECQCPRARHQHGDYRTYNADDCRCDACRAAAAAQRARNKRLRLYRAWNTGHPDPYVPSTASWRRLQALARIGWTAPRLAQRLGTSEHQLRKLRSGLYRTIRPETAAAIAALYDELWNQPQRDTDASKTIWAATQRGWPPPAALDDDMLDEITMQSSRVVQMGYDNTLHAPLSRRNSLTAARFIDDIAVERRIAGDPVPLTRAELSQAWQTLERMGWSAAEIGVRLGVSSRTVQRYRQRERRVA